MKILLFSIIILFSIQGIFVYGQLESDIDFMVYKGGQYLKMFNYEEAMTFFDKVLEIDPKNVHALNGKGDAFYALKKYEASITYYEQVLNIESKNNNALRGLESSLAHITSFQFGFLDGVLEITVHDSKGGLIAYQKTTKILALKHQITEDSINKWPAIKKVQRNNQNYVIHQKEFVEVLEKTTILGFHEIHYSNDVNFLLASTWHYQIPVERGDVVNYTYSIFVPVD